MSRPLRTCAPAEVQALLPGALAGEYLLAPVADRATAELLQSRSAVVELDDGGVLVTTSGSTGTPKGVLLSATAIRAACDAFRERFGAFHWTLALPTGYVAGVMVLARGYFDQGHGGGHGQSLDAQLTGLATRPDTMISLVPTQLIRALRDPELNSQLAHGGGVLLGGAAVPDGLLDQAGAAGVRVLTSYGMSETCGGCVIDGVPLPGVQVELGEHGRIAIAGPVLFSGYLNDPDATATSLVGGRLITNDRGAWVDTEKGRRLRVLGRFDDVVISGGVNVDLAAVERAVQALARGPVAVVGVPDAEWGTRVVLAATDPEWSLDDWRTALRPSLGAAALPRQLVHLDALPRTTSGKVDRAAVRRLTGQP